MYYEKPRSVLRMQMFLLPLLLSASLGVHFLERHAKGNKQNMKIYRNVQSRLGGANYSKCIKNCMSRCLSDMLMSTMNMKGKKGLNRKIQFVSNDESDNNSTVPCCHRN